MNEFNSTLVTKASLKFSKLCLNMAGGDVAPAGVELKGWAIKFNSYTKTGRANVAMATYGVIGAIVLLKKMTKKS